MTIDVGQTLGKYELMERVGQGGMAVVYRGVDRTLRREVAVKVLHRHLAESMEARDRFEREAQAVAKLRHENILEIFDFSGNESDESYIVTEFIDGQTLKEFVGEHEIRYPEVGAMIAVQVCRALVHAHGLGVLHRDIKPENIMIRNDGVVKLTDFGIAQMLDLQRMTVTGQLLGSPAYMSPEHVEGKQLDFRTDVFAVGVVLYQLVVGDLPFQGKNPHEILKKIAECEYRPAEVANPLVGKELGRIIRKALAREKEDRYLDVSQMLDALERYLDGSGLSSYSEELARFFESAASYELALRPRLVSHLTRRGKKLLEDDRVAALEVFNRVLNLDPKNEEVLHEIDKLSRRQRWAKAAVLFGTIALLGGGVLTARALWPASGGEPGERLPALAVTEAADAAPAAEADGAVALAAVPADAAAEPPGFDAGAGAKVTERRDPEGDHSAGHGTKGHHGGAHPKSEAPDAGPAELSARVFRLTVSPRRGSEVQVGDGPWKPVTGRRMKIEIPPGRVRVSARNEGCCESKSVVLGEQRTGGPVSISLDFLPAEVVPKCDQPGVEVRIAGELAPLGRPKLIPLFDTFGSKKVTVEFFTDDDFDKRTVTVRPRERKTVRCRH